jgi:hypothetical protein
VPTGKIIPDFDSLALVVAPNLGLGLFFVSLLVVIALQISACPETPHLNLALHQPK